MRQDLTDISIVLDRSGSMETVRGDTIGGYNSFVEMQKAQPGEALLTLMQFDTAFDLVHSGVRIADVPPLSYQTFVPRGATALLDAIGRTINETGTRLKSIAEAQRPGKVLFVIITDGQENASSEFNRAKINAMIEHQRSAYAWEFVFLGANQDAIQEGTAIGITATRSMTYAANTLGTASAFTSVSNLASSYRVGGQSIFTAEDRAKQTEAGAEQPPTTLTSSTTSGTVTASS